MLRRPSDNPPRVKPRRVHVKQVHPGVIELADREAHHLRDVLRLKVGDLVEVFDDEGNVAEADIIRCGAGGVAVAVAQVRATAAATLDANPIELVVASAVPKGERADWMIEKLSELGVSRFIPLAAARSVVLPEGKNKRDRWIRIATEAARQSRRSGVMSIAPLMKVDDVIQASRGSTGLVLSTANDSRPILDVVQSSILHRPFSLTLLIGPEGGWTDEELSSCASGGLTGARLTATILRVETAAVAAAAVAAAALTGAGASHR